MPYIFPLSIREIVACDRLSSFDISDWDIPKVSLYFFSVLAFFKILNDAFDNAQRYAVILSLDIHSPDINQNAPDFSAVAINLSRCSHINSKDSFFL